MNQKHHLKAVIFIGVSLVPLSATASDFNVLFTGMAALLIALILAFLCIKGSSAASTKTRSEVAGYSFGSIFLTLIGLALVSEESAHMANTDFYGLLGVILVPGILATLLPLILSKPNMTDDDSE